MSQRSVYSHSGSMVAHPATVGQPTVPELAIHSEHDGWRSLLSVTAKSREVVLSSCGNPDSQLTIIPFLGTWPIHAKTTMPLDTPIHRFGLLFPR